MYRISIPSATLSEIFVILGLIQKTKDVFKHTAIRIAA